MATMAKLFFLKSISVTLLLFSSISQADDAATICSHPLGLTSGIIEDWQLAASSAISRQIDPSCAVKFARINADHGRAWCAGKRSENEWILIDLGVESQVSGVVTQGRNEVDEWVSAFMISYSTTAFQWEFARDIYGNKKVFKGNSDAHSLRHSYLEHPVNARFVRVHVVKWHKHPSLRLEIIGCQKCNSIISVQPFSELTASTHKRWRKRKTCMPEMGDINSNKGWCPRHQNSHQWLQFDLGPPTKITGLVTRGQGDRKTFVTSYTISYSNDSSLWYYYKDANHLEPKIFGGNMDRNTERRHYLNQPVTARYLRVHPLSWHKRIGLRGAVIGCPHEGSCGHGFMRVNSGSACVPNKAYAMSTWVNDKRHTEKQWRYGHSSLAVDGNEDVSLSNCAIMDNYFVNDPVWMVDLGKEVSVNGVVVLAWQGKGEDKITAYANYVFNLEKFTVYVSNRSPDFYHTNLRNETLNYHDPYGYESNEIDENRIRRRRFDVEKSSKGKHPFLSHRTKCATITRKNNALFNPRLHFECPETKKGRYVYIRAKGVENRWKKLFTVVLCEVMVY